MKIMKKTVGLILALTLILLQAAATVPKAITMGTLEGTKYTNEYFGLELNVPESWHIATEEKSRYYASRSGGHR